MKRPSLLLFLLLNLAAFAQSANDIVNKYIAATGGADKWSKITALKYTGSYIMGPGMLAPVTGVYLSKPFKGSYSDFSWQGMTSKQAIRADSGWSYNPFGGKRETDPVSPDDVRSDRLGSDPQGLLFNYKQKGYVVEYLGMDDMEGTDVYKLRLTTPQGDMVYYYLDSETYYVLKEVQRVKLKDKELKTAFLYSDFRKTDFGVVIPFSSQRVDENGAEQGGPVNFTKVEINAPVDAALFDKPKL
ncbi:MAG TPA: hypothetical protein VK174_03510 [Chitinophagales bacterium]|nr:hypothetical protein [Chitinophagales bacterium]